MQKSKMFVLLTISLLVILPTFATSSFFMYEVDASEIDVPDLEEGDLSDVLDVLLDNITVEIAPATTAAGIASSAQSQVIELGKLIVRASTFDYSVREFSEDYNIDNIPVFHKTSAEFTKAYFAAAAASNTFSLYKMSSMVGVGSAVTGVMGVNDTSEASGYTDSWTERYSLEDLEPETTVVQNVTSYNNYAAVEPYYHQFANFTESNETFGQFLPDGVDVDDNKNFKNYVSGFDNIQSEIYGILETVIAANYSTPGDVIDPDRVSIIESDTSNANMTTYMTQNFVDRARAVINNEFLESESSVVILGFLKFKLGKIIHPAAAFFSLPNLNEGFSRIISLGQTAVSAPLRIAKDTLANIKNTIIDKPIKAITGTITKGVNSVKGLVHTAMKSPERIVKTIGGVANNFINKAEKSVTSIVSTGGNLLTKGVSSITGIVKSVTGQLPLLVAIGVTVLVIIAILYIKFFRAPSVSVA